MTIIAESSDDRLCFIALSTITGMLRNYNVEFNPSDVTRLVEIVFRYLSIRDTESPMVTYALICLVDVCLRFRASEFTIQHIFASLSNQKFQISALFLFFEDASERFRTPPLTDGDFAFGFFQLQTLPCSIDWLKLWLAMVDVAPDIEVFVPIVDERWRQCVIDHEHILMLIEVIEKLLSIEINGIGVIHSCVMHAGAQISVLLREELINSDCENLRVLGVLWTCLLSVEDVELTFLQEQFVPMMEAVYTECFVSLELLMTASGTIPDWEIDDWMDLISSLVKMCQCFGESADNVGHPLEWFVVRSLDFIVRIMDAGLQDIEEYCLLSLLYKSAPHLCCQYLMEKPASQSPNLIRIVSLLIEHVPEEIVAMYLQNVGQIATYSPLVNMTEFVTKVALQYPQNLPAMLTQIMQLFVQDPAVVAVHIQELSNKYSEQIAELDPNHTVVQAVIAAIPRVEIQERKLLIMTVANLSLNLRNDSLNASLQAIYHALVQLMGCSETVDIICFIRKVVRKLSTNRTELVIQFGVALFDSLVQLPQLWQLPSEEVQSELAKLAASGLASGMCSQAAREFTAAWINEMITRAQVSEYLLCVPFLTDFWPLLTNIAGLVAFCAEVDRRTLALSYSGMFHTVREMTWQYLPLELFVECLREHDHVMRFLELAESIHDMIPAEAVPHLLGVIVHESVYSYPYCVGERALAVIHAFGVAYPDVLLGCCTAMLPGDATVNFVRMFLSDEADENARSCLFSEFRTCLCRI